MIGLIIRPDLQFRHLVFEIMRGKLKTSFLESEDMAIVEGTEVEIVDGWCGCDGYFYQCELPEGRQIIMNSVNIEITDYRPYIDWDQRRYELVKSFAASIISSHTVEEINSSFLKDGYGYEIVADLSVELADVLIKKLKLV